MEKATITVNSFMEQGITDNEDVEGFIERVLKTLIPSDCSVSVSVNLYCDYVNEEGYDSASEIIVKVTRMETDEELLDRLKGRVSKLKEEINKLEYQIEAEEVE